MPRLVNATPKYRRHRASGQAVVTIAGKDHYLGPHGTKASHREYDRLVGEWPAAGRPLNPAPAGPEMTIVELVADFWRYAKEKYRKNGRSTGTAENFKPVLSFLEQRYGHTRAADFGPLALKALQNAMVAEGHSRRYVNDNTHRIRRMFRWGDERRETSSFVPDDELLAVSLLAIHQLLITTTRELCRLSQQSFVTEFRKKISAMNVV